MQRMALLAILLLLTGCASMGNTLAQDLAYERMKKCEGIGASLRFDRIDPDGTVWIRWFGGTQGVTEWQACMRKAAEEQAAQRRMAAPPPQPAITTVPGTTAAGEATQPSPSPSTAVLAPLWKRGDEWAFRYESPAGSGTYVWSVDREEAVDGVPHYVIKAGTREIFYRKADIAFTRETVSGAVVTQYTPARLRYVWPLEVGKTWEQTVREDKPVDRQTIERVDVVTVEAEETITVPAGTFKTLKIVYRNKGTGAVRYEEWYSPELKSAVQLRERLDFGLRVRELFAYKLK